MIFWANKLPLPRASVIVRQSAAAKSARFLRQALFVTPFRHIVQDPEDAGDGFALVKEHKAYLTLIQKGAAFLTQNQSYT